MAPPTTSATAPFAPSLAQNHEHNIDRCDDSMEKNGSCQNSPPLNLSASLLSAKIVANSLRPFLGRANECTGTSSTTDNEDTNTKQGETFSRRSGLDILNSLNIHDNSVARRLVQLADQQQKEVGDGTKTAVILAGSILEAAESLMKTPEDAENKNDLCPSQISLAFVNAADYAVEVMKAHSQQVDIANSEYLQNLCHHHLSSTFSGGNDSADDNHAELLSQLTIDAILKLDEQNGEEECLPDLDKIQIVREISGNVKESGVFAGFILKRPESGVGVSGGAFSTNNSQVPCSAVSVVTNATEAAPKSLEGDVKVCFVEHWMSPVEIPADCDEETREEMLREDRRRLLSDCKQIKKSGAKVVLIAAEETGGGDGESVKDDSEGVESRIDANLQICLHFLAKMGIMAISGLKGETMDDAVAFLGGVIIPFPENISLKELGSAKQVHEVKAPSGTTWIHFEGTRTPVATIMLHGPTETSIEELEYTVGRILSFVANLFRDPYVVAGGGAAEIEASLRLRIQSTAAADDVHSQCMRAFADALEVIPYTLAENSDINPAAVVTALRRQHAEGQTVSGLDIGDVGGIHVDMIDAGIVTSLTTQLSAIQLATTFACALIEERK